MRRLSIQPCGGQRLNRGVTPAAPTCCGLSLAAWIALAASAQPANAQTSAPSDSRAQQQSQFPQAQQASPQLPASGSPSGAQTSLPSAPNQEDALENPVLEEADEDDEVTGLESRIAFTYDYAGFDGGASGDYLRLEWVQAFGPGKRLAVKVEFPYFIHFDGGANEPNANGVGDTLVEFAAMLGKTEKFEHAAAVEVTAPSASDRLVRSEVLGAEGETVIRAAWGFSAQVTEHTLLSGNLGYNKAVHARYGPETINEIEPELILSQAFGKRVGSYLEWNTYYDFTESKWAQAMKVGIEFLLDRKEKWSLSPYFAFALNDFAREMDFRNNAGVYLSRHF
jgi:hypothetical protein